MPPFPNISTIGLTFDLDLSPTDLNIYRGHLLIKDYLPTENKVSGAKRSWVISCTRRGRPRWSLTLTFDQNINRDRLLIKDYLPTKFEASGAKRSWVISYTRWSRREWSLTLNFDLLTWISIGIIYSSWTIYLPSFKFMRWGVIELLDAQVVLGGYRRTDRYTDMCKAICPFLLSKEGINIICILL